MERGKDEKGRVSIWLRGRKRRETNLGQFEERHVIIAPHSGISLVLIAKHNKGSVDCQEESTFAYFLLLRKQFKTSNPRLT